MSAADAYGSAEGRRKAVDWWRENGFPSDAPQSHVRVPNLLHHEGYIETPGHPTGPRIEWRHPASCDCPEVADT